ncbi:MAG: phosphate regulon sensor histidine kinase PhoR [Betaproteobacteria bacterium]
MVWRVLSFFLFQFTGAALGYALGPGHRPWLGVVLGLVLADTVWVSVDLRRSARLLHWLRLGRVLQLAELGGLWGEVAERTRSLLKARDLELAKSDQRLTEFLAAIQTSPNGVVLLDAQGRIEWCNRTAADHFGFELERDLQQQIGNLVRDPAFAAYQAAQDYSHAVVIPGPGSTISRPVRLSVDLHPYGDGRKLLLSRDVTVLEQAEAMRRDFVANVSHEIRTPLTVLSGFVETLQNLPLQPHEQQRYLGLMAQQAQRMQLLVSDLLTLSRLEGSPAPPTDDWHGVQELMDHCERDARALSEVLTPQGRRMRFAAPVAGELAGAASELLSAMSNLVSNAVRYTPATGQIDVLWQTLGDGRAEFSVHDTGPGIAPEHLPRLTERFYRVDRSRARETGGTGLGLAIVKHVAQRHGAQLRIESTPGQGSRFTILFPANRIRGHAAMAVA